MKYGPESLAEFLASCEKALSPYFLIFPSRSYRLFPNRATVSARFHGIPSIVCTLSVTGRGGGNK
uniref:Uncharacterized protein n=1 Tax=Anguilla anguilla TaxID=7936 RepID=A0A0E9UFW0_ANGAN